MDIRSVTFEWDVEKWSVHRDKIKLKIQGKNITLPFRNPIGANIDGSRSVKLVVEVPYAPTLRPSI